MLYLRLIVFIRIVAGSTFFQRPFGRFSGVTSACHKTLREREKMGRGIENSRGMYDEGVARVVGCILSRMRSRRSLHSDVQHDENRGDIANGYREGASRGWMDAKSEKRADKYKFLFVFFRQSGYGMLSRLYVAHFKPLCISSLLTKGAIKSNFSIVHAKIFPGNRSFCIFNR